MAKATEPDGQGVIKNPTPADRALATQRALDRQDMPKGAFVKAKPGSPPPNTPANRQRVNASDDGPRATVKAKLAKLSPSRRRKLAAALRQKGGKA